MSTIDFRDSIRDTIGRDSERPPAARERPVFSKLASIRMPYSWILVAILGFCGHKAPAQESYYVIVFGSQQTPPRATYSHTFAIFVRVCHSCNSPEGRTVESHIISWMPRTLDIRVHAVLPEPGVNLDLDSTMRWAMATCQRTSMWGPYQIERDLYCRAMERLALLQSGKVRYKAIDTGYPLSIVSNCIHAVSGIVGGIRLYVSTPNFGETASFDALRRMEPWIIDCEHKHEWLVPVLGLDRYPLIHRDWEKPRSGLVWYALRSSLGMEP
jgi:hypothetical protein